MNTVLHESYVIFKNQTCIKLAKWRLLQNNEIISGLCDPCVDGRRLHGHQLATKRRHAGQ